MNLKLLVKYLCGECSEKEENFVEQWLRADPQNEEFLQSLRKIWTVEPDNDISVNAEEAWEKFSDNVLKDDRKKNHKTLRTLDSYHVKTGSKYIYFHIAAVAALILFVFLFLSNVYVAPEKSEKEQFTMREIITERGERSRIKLSDGTLVVLNSDSWINIPTQFVGDSREVYLTGEAHFEVNQNKGKPFIVHTNNSFTKVLGTTFVVSAYPTNNDILVAVTEGKVLMGAKEEKTSRSGIIEKEHVGILQDEDRPLITRVKNLKKYTGWVNGKLIFDKDPFQKVKDRIERTYDINIAVKDSSVFERKLTAKFHKESLNEILDIVALSLDLKYQREGKQVKFAKQHE